MTKENPTISILLPVKNGAHHLVDCLRSITQQSFEDWELIAVNDHSSDDTPEILEAFENSEERMRVFHSDGNGILPAMEWAFEISRGNIITRMDGDDLMLEDKLHTMHQTLKSKGPGRVITSKIKYIASGKPLEGGYRRYQRWINERCEKSDHFEHIYEECVLPSPNWMVYREDLQKVESFSNQRYPEDYDLCFQFYEHDTPIVPIDETLHTWRDHPLRNTRTNPIYADPTYFGIKTDYFMKLDRHRNRPLVLYGAGGKGKKVARIWQDRSIDFEWTCSTRSKWGHDIYGTIIKSPEDIPFKQVQTIVAISSPIGRFEVDRELHQRGLRKMIDYIHFC